MRGICFPSQQQQQQQQQPPPTTTNNNNNNNNNNNSNNNSNNNNNNNNKQQQHPQQQETAATHRRAHQGKQPSEQPQEACCMRPPVRSPAQATNLQQIAGRHKYLHCIWSWPLAAWTAVARWRPSLSLLFLPPSPLSLLSLFCFFSKKKTLS